MKSLLLVLPFLGLGSRTAVYERTVQAIPQSTGNAFCETFHGLSIVL